MPEVTCCPQCGCSVPPDSPDGLCPACLLRHGLADGGPEAKFADHSVTEVRQPPSRFVPPKPSDLANRFPQFEVLDLLGHGGMGAVCKARQKSLDRLVALKIINPDAADDAGFAERFAREARALAKLSHSNIVAVYDFGESDGLFYFVMEFVDGTDLRHLLSSEELSPDQAIQIVSQVCEALQYAHDEGIVHRDVKPENILLDSKGRVKIADFGLAKLLGAETMEDQALTATHQVMGTPRYMAPEQMEGSHAVDHRADIYSLGVVFYEMLTGELPVGQFEVPSQKVQVDVRLDEIVMKAIAKEPERRYQHASRVKTDVEAVSGGGGEYVVPPVRLVGAAGKPGDDNAEKSSNERSVPIRFTDVLLGLAVTMPIFALIGFALALSTSGWVLVAQAIPWFGLATGGSYFSEKQSERQVEKALGLVAMIAFVVSVSLIAFGIWIERSGWPIFAVVPILVAIVAGSALGSSVAQSETEEDGESPQDDAKQTAEQVEEEDESPPKEKLQSVAWAVGFVGGFRALGLFSNSNTFIEQLFGGEFLLPLTGPVMVAAAVAMYHSRYYWLAVVAGVMCFASGSWIAIGIGIWCLVVLFDPKVQKLFAVEKVKQGSPSHFAVKRPISLAMVMQWAAPSTTLGLNGGRNAIRCSRSLPKPFSCLSTLAVCSPF